jgi:CRP-like cAMP-binding protein
MLREIALFGAGVPSVLLYFLAPVALFLAVDQLPKLNLAVYDRGETLVKPGRVLNALFLIGRGVLSATCDAIEGEIELERFGPGDHYGEIGMLTGSPSIAKIAALTPVVVYELAKNDLTPILETSPQVEEKLSRALAQHQAASRLDAETGLGETQPTKALAAWFSERLHRLDGVASAAG